MGADKRELSIRLPGKQKRHLGYKFFWDEIEYPIKWELWFNMLNQLGRELKDQLHYKLNREIEYQFGDKLLDHLEAELLGDLKRK